MKTTLNIDDQLMAEAMRLSGIREKTQIRTQGLKYFISIEAGKRLAKMGGKDPKAKITKRNRK